MCRWLASTDTLIEEHVHSVLTGLGICGNHRFEEVFKLLAQTADLSSISTVLPNIPNDVTPLEQMEALLEKAVDLHKNLVVSGNWNTATKGGESSILTWLMMTLVHLRERVGSVARKDAVLGIATRQKIRIESAKIGRSTTSIKASQFLLEESHGRKGMEVIQAQQVTSLALSIATKFGTHIFFFGQQWLDS